jgi:hypothetical protein
MGSRSSAGSGYEQPAKADSCNRPDLNVHVCPFSIISLVSLSRTAQDMAIQPPADMSTFRQSAAAGSSSQPMTPLPSSPPSRNAEQNGQAEPFAASNPASASATRSGTSPAMSRSGTGARRRPNYKLTQTIYAHKRAVTALKWTADGRMLVSAGAFS